MNRRRHRAAFALLEMLFTIVIAGVAAVIAARLFALTGQTYRRAAEATDALRAERQWLTAMRSDAWAATIVKADDSSTASFTLGGGAVTWKWDDATLTRAIGTDVQRWPVARAMRWRLDGRSVAVIGDVEAPLATPSVQSSEAR